MTTNLTPFEILPIPDRDGEIEKYHLGLGDFTTLAVWAKPDTAPEQLTLKQPRSMNFGPDHPDTVALDREDVVTMARILGITAEELTGASTAGTAGQDAHPEHFADVRRRLANGEALNTI